MKEIVIACHGFAGDKESSAILALAKEIDKEVHDIIDRCHADARKIISQHMDVLHKCAALLLEKEKIQRDEFEALFTAKNEMPQE